MTSVRQNSVWLTRQMPSTIDVKPKLLRRAAKGFVERDER